MKDQSELSKLYPNVTGRTDNMSYRAGPAATKKVGHITIFNVFAISILLTVPFGLFLFMMNYLNQTISYGIIVFLPIIVLSLILWISLLILCLVKISKNLENSGISNALFLIIYSLCALPVSQFIYETGYKIGNGFAETLPLVAILFFENFVFVFLILALINTKKISENSKTIILLLAVFICVGLALININ